MMYLSVLLLLLPANIFTYNIDTNHFIVYVDPELRGNISTSYFGYSGLLYPGDKNGRGKWVKIGAPKGQDPELKSRFPKSGVVYNCPFMEKCSPLDILQGGVERNELLEGAWIGGSMDINYKFQRMAICGFRRIEVYNADETHHNLVGSCYSMRINGTFDYITPLKDQPFVYNEQFPKGTYFYGQGEAGFSLHLPEDEDALILGAPGVYNWAGTLIKIGYEEVNGPIASRLRSRRHTKQVINIGDTIHYTFSFQFELFGYSATSGHYYGGKTLYYVATSPKYPVYRGKASIVQFNGNKPLKEKTSLVGSQLGEYFGASSTSGDLNSDGYDDLIIGAPYHATKTYNEGATYIFLGRREGQLREQPTLYGQQTNGQFGTSLMFLGDINNDGFGDLAVGAPYEEKFSGVLYIYRGSKDGIEMLPCQRIVGKDISLEIRGFGISIARPADMDENYYQDLLVGSYLSGHAVLLRTNPIVVVEYEMTATPNKLTLNTRQIIVNICFKYTHFKNHTLELKRTISVEDIANSAVFKNAKDKIRNIVIKGIDTYNCENVTVLLNSKVENEVDVKFSLSYNLVEQEKRKNVIYISQNYKKGKDTYCVRCPVLDEDRSHLARSINVPYTQDCGSDDICHAKLTIDANFLKLKHEGRFVVGSENYLDLNATVRNSGEHAYSTQLEIMLLGLMYFRQTPPQCTEKNKTVIVCNLYTIAKNNQKTVSLNLDMSLVNEDSVNSNFSILLKVFTTSNNTNTSEKILPLILEREASIQITGKSLQQSVPFGKKIDENATFTQRYQVVKMGASPIEKVFITITIPLSIKTASGPVNLTRVFPPHVTFAGQPIMCSSNIEYIAESKDVGVQEILNSESTLKRRKRQVEVFKDMDTRKKEDIVINGKEYYLTQDRTSYVNCSMDDVVCSQILCSVGPLEKKETLVDINIKMMLDLSVAAKLFKEKDFVIYTTQGMAEMQFPPQLIVGGNRSDLAAVSSIFINENKGEGKVALWIIILAIILGILLLALIIYGLTKIGFFKREEKEKLMNLKAEHFHEIEAQKNEEQRKPGLESSGEGPADEDIVVESPEGLADQNPGMNASTEGLVDEL